MATATGAFDTYEAIGNREDLANRIDMISPTSTPFMSGIGRGVARATYHEFQTDALDTPADNSVIEGEDATTDASTATTRLGNYTQISDKVPMVTGTQEVVDHAGRSSEMAHQVAKAAKALKTDVETGLLKNTVQNAGSTSAARISAGVPTWLATNTDHGSGGSAGTSGTTAATNGTQRTFTEAMLKTVLQGCWDEGGDPDCILVGSFNKQTFSTFTGNATRNIGAQDRELIATIDIYVSDFGDMEVVPSRLHRARDCLVIQKDKWKFCPLRPYRLVSLAKNGDHDRKQLIVEWTLESCNEAANGFVADLSTS